MSRKVCAAVVLVLLAGLPFILSAFAGGWAVVTLDQLPEDIISGKPVEIGFMLRGHGVTPIKTEGLSVEAKHQESGARVSAPARSEGAEGHYLASLSFPQSGPWEWGISTGPYGFTQPMPALDVLPSGPIQQADLPNFLPASYWTIAGLSIAAAVLLTIRRKPIRWAATVAVAGLAVSGLGVAISTAPASETGDSIGGISAPTSGSLEALGADLFIAKGCVVCHNHAEIPDRLIAFQTNHGPDLSGYTSSPAFLELWLSDPVEIKPKTQMPDLMLSETEIEALISFINKGS